MQQTVKIIGVSNGVTKVAAISGSQRDSDLFVDGDGLGTIGGLLELPEFRIEDFESETAKRYEAE